MITVTIYDERSRREHKGFFITDEELNDLADWRASNYECSIVKARYWPIADKYVWRFFHFCELYAGIGSEFSGYEVI